MDTNDAVRCNEDNALGQKALILDFDGVITDSEKYWAGLIKDLAEAHGLTWTDDMQARTRGLSQSDTWKLLYDNYGLRISKEQYFQEMNEAIERMYATKAALIEGVVDFIIDARVHGFKLAIATSSARQWVELFLRRFGLENAFDEIVTAGDRFKGKPEPDVYLEVLSRLGVSANEAVAIEDSTNGVLSAASAGIMTVGLLNGLNTSAELKDATVIADSFTKVSRMIWRTPDMGNSPQAVSSVLSNGLHDDQNKSPDEYELRKLWLEEYKIRADAITRRRGLQHQSILMLGATLTLVTAFFFSSDLMFNPVRVLLILLVLVSVVNCYLAIQHCHHSLRIMLYKAFINHVVGKRIECPSRLDVVSYNVFAESYRKEGIGRKPCPEGEGTERAEEDACPRQLFDGRGFLAYIVVGIVLLGASVLCLVFKADSAQFYNLDFSYPDYLWYWVSTGFVLGSFASTVAAFLILVARENEIKAYAKDYARVGDCASLKAREKQVKIISESLST